MLKRTVARAVARGEVGKDAQSDKDQCASLQARFGNASKTTHAGGHSIARSTIASELAAGHFGSEVYATAFRLLRPMSHPKVTFALVEDMRVKRVQADASMLQEALTSIVKRPSLNEKDFESTWHTMVSLRAAPSTPHFRLYTILLAKTGQFGRAMDLFQLLRCPPGCRTPLIGGCPSTKGAWEVFEGARAGSNARDPPNPLFYDALLRPRGRTSPIWQGRIGFDDARQ
eukprot:gene4856-7495_t